DPRARDGRAQARAAALEAPRGDAGMSLLTRLNDTQYRFLHAIRHPGELDVGRRPGTAKDFSALNGGRHVLIVTFRRSGEPIPTPVNFGLDGEGRVYFRSERRVPKIRRIENDPHVRVCPCNFRGKPTGPVTPYTAEEYAAEARRVVDEGGSMIHIHARRPDGTPSYEVHDFREITEAIRAEVDDVVINYSTGAIGVPIEKRIEYLRELRPDVAALNMGSMNYAKYSRRRKDFVFKAVFENSFDTISEFLRAMRELDIRPEQ